jgi:serine/threonine protein kinase
MSYWLRIAAFVFLCVCSAVIPTTQITAASVSTEMPSHFGVYKVIKFLGKGDQAKVYLAQDGRLKKFAIKVFYTKSEFAALHPERKKKIHLFFEKDGSSKAAEAEYTVSKQLDHPQIMKIYGRHETMSQTGEKVTYLVMEYIDGKNLDQKQTGSLSKNESLQLAKQLISTLQHAFSKGLSHNDLWSENIFVDKQGNLKLIDLGSFDPLPSVKNGEKVRGNYKKYSAVIKHNLKRIFELGTFTKKERSRLDAAIDECIKNSDNCQISQESKKTIVANLDSVYALLTTYNKD